jgi:hypothetical protein
VLTWTVRTPDDARRAAAYADAPIAEGAVLHLSDHAGPTMRGPIMQNRPQHHDSGRAGRAVGGRHRARGLGPPGRPDNPFTSHAFLTALEESGSVGGRSGWTPLAAADR